MSVSRVMSLAVAAVGLTAASPASAQFFFKSRDVTGERVTGTEPGITGQALPGATPAELRAALVWNLRAALNVAALQCQFEPTLLTLPNYNALLRDHADELKESYDTLTGYFMRTAGSKKAGQAALDQFGTRVYAGFATVAAQLIFCQTAGRVGHDALFVPPGGLGEFAQMRLKEIRNALVPWGEQQFPNGYNLAVPTLVQFRNPKCWDDGEWRTRRCGTFTY